MVACMAVMFNYGCGGGAQTAAVPLEVAPLSAPLSDLRHDIRDYAQREFSRAAARSDVVCSWYLDGISRDDGAAGFDAGAATLTGVRVEIEVTAHCPQTVSASGTGRALFAAADLRTHSAARREALREAAIQAIDDATMRISPMLSGSEEP